MLGHPPTLVRALIPKGEPRADLSSLKALCTTGEPWNPGPYAWLFEHVGGSRAPIVNISGGTEVGACFLATAITEPIKPVALGFPALGEDMDVVDPDGKPVRGEVGELVCRRPWPGMTRGIWGDDERYLDTYWRRFPGVWTHGDWASVDADGYWFLHGRSDDTMNIAGKRIGPAELESAAIGSGLVAEAAAVGVPHDVKGEVAWIFCVAKPGEEPDDARVATAVTDVLGKAFKPDRIVWVTALPKLAAGLAQKRGGEVGGENHGPYTCTVRLAIAQINPVVGDLAGNREVIVARLEDAKSAGADLVLFPELAVTGYPPEDLLLRPGFVRAAERSLEEIARAARGIVAVVGTPYFERDLYNAAAVCAAGEVKAFVKKRFLPNYGVFDEFRYFAPGDGLYLFEHGETLIGVTVCEDMWQPGPPATDLALAGAELIVNISASPFHLLREREREEMFRTRARDTASFVALCNTVGGQDELIFDGHSFVIDDEGAVIARAKGFEEDLLVVDVEPSAVVARRLTDTRRRALAQDRGELGAVQVVHVGAPHEHADTLEPSLVPFCDDLEQMRLALEL